VIRKKHFFGKNEETWLPTVGSEKQNPADWLPQAATQQQMGARDACRLQRWGDTPLRSSRHCFGGR